MVERIVGVDLTDAYARAPRPVDVAIIDAATGTVNFTDFDYPPRGPGWAGALAETISALAGPGAVLVIDGPQALADPQNPVRAVETQLGTPGRTPWQMPTPGQMPFAGYVRSSVETFAALVAAGRRLADLDGHDQTTANLYEAYPGAVWRLLHPAAAGRLESKSTRVGLQQREAILLALGCRFGQAVLNHDRLDAALCAMLGWKYLAAPSDLRVELVGRPVSRDGGGTLREGRMLMPQRPDSPLKVAPFAVAPPAAPVPTVSPAPRPASSKPPAAAGSGGCVELPVECEWLYLAARKAAPAEETYELAEQLGILVRTAHRDTPPNYGLITHVANVRPGDRMLLAFRVENAPCRPMAMLQINEPEVTVDRTPALTPITDTGAIEFLERLNYPRDPKLQKFTAFTVSVLEDLQSETWRISSPGMNAIYRVCKK